MDSTKEERIAEFLRRMNRASAAGTFDDAYRLLCETLDAVENEMTTIARDPGNWQTDGGMYPPLVDSMRDVSGHRGVKRFRSLGHNTFISENGAVEIQEVRGTVVVFQKDGADGRGVWND